MKCLVSNVVFMELHETRAHSFCKILQEGLSLNFDNFRANPMNFHKFLLDCHITHHWKLKKCGGRGAGVSEYCENEWERCLKIEKTGRGGVGWGCWEIFKSVRERNGVKWIAKISTTVAYKSFNDRSAL